jgi:hypothetical protein
LDPDGSDEYFEMKRKAIVRCLGAGLLDYFRLEGEEEIIDALDVREMGLSITRNQILAIACYGNTDAMESLYESIENSSECEHKYSELMSRYLLIIGLLRRSDTRWEVMMTDTGFQEILGGIRPNTVLWQTGDIPRLRNSLSMVEIMSIVNGLARTRDCEFSGNELAISNGHGGGGEIGLEVSVWMQRDRPTSVALEPKCGILTTNASVAKVEGTARTMIAYDNTGSYRRRDGTDVQVLGEGRIYARQIIKVHKGERPMYATAQGGRLNWLDWSEVREDVQSRYNIRRCQQILDIPQSRNRSVSKPFYGVAIYEQQMTVRPLRMCRVRVMSLERIRRHVYDQWGLDGLVLVTEDALQRITDYINKSDSILGDSRRVCTVGIAIERCAGPRNTYSWIRVKTRIHSNGMAVANITYDLASLIIGQGNMSWSLREINKVN